MLVVKNGLNGSGILCRMDPIVLYVDGFWNSPYAFSVFVCLKEKGLTLVKYSRVEVGGQ